MESIVALYYIISYHVILYYIILHTYTYIKQIKRKKKTGIAVVTEEKKGGLYDCVVRESYCHFDEERNKIRDITTFYDLDRLYRLYSIYLYIYI